MMQLSKTAIVLCVLCHVTAAFHPSPKTTTRLHAPSAWGLTPEGTTNEMFVDENFDDVDVVRLLGLRRVKKMIRKNRRVRNGSKLQATAEPVETAAPRGLRIIIAGAPASGKGTQCESIKEAFGVVHLSTGDMLRAAVAAQTDVGKTAKDFMDAGKLVPDEVIIGVVKDRLEESDCAERGWLLDGFPRTRAQADALASAGISADCFLFLNVPDEILVERVVGRRTDPETGKIYHMTFSPPDDEEVINRLEHRSDDTEEKVVVRLEQFHANVDAVKGCYENISVEIDGSVKPDVVAGNVGKILEDCRAKVAAAV